LIGHIYKTSQGIYCLNPADQFVSKELVQTGQYSSGEIATLSTFLDVNSRVLLLGGHIGSLCIPLSKKVAEMVVFEANPETYELLKINLALNHASNITAYNLAANHEFGTLDFVMNTVNSGGSKRMPKERADAYFYDNPEVRKVPAVRLDDFLHGQSFDLIFMDIEGSEYFAMKGMPKLLEQASALVVEFLPHHLSSVAGVTFGDFAECLVGFQNLISMAQKEVVHGESAIKQLLEKMMNENIADMGLILHKQKINASFG
jgi:FkbM family methyltransferase